MSIPFLCSHCGKKLSAPDERAGQRARCPACRGALVVPPVEPTARSSNSRSGGPQRPASKPIGAHVAAFSVPSAAPPDHELIDMTAMVDIVFFLLIFFMVTSMHSMQSSIALPTPEAKQNRVGAVSVSAATSDQVVVQVDADDTIAVDGEEVGSRQELIAHLRAAERENLLVLASGEATHGAVVMVLDAGSDAGMEQIRLMTEGLDND